MMIERWWLGLAGLSGAAGVAVEAAARHWVAADPHRLELAATGARYALLHAPALLGVCALVRHAGAGPARRSLQLAGSAFATGLVLFSGSLYWLAAGLPAAIAPLTPVGGIGFIVGWMAVLAAAVLASVGTRD